MTDERTDLEGRLHGLLGGDLSPAERRAALRRIIRDEAARRTLDEMLAVQERSREAFGYDRADEAMREPMERLSASLAPGEAPGEAPEEAPGEAPEEVPVAPHPTPSDRKRNAGRRPWPVWLVRVAAASVIAASVFAAGVSWRNNRLLREKMKELHAPVAVARVTPAERDGYRHIWENVAGGGEGRPWILLSDGTGEFGYLPPAGTEADPSGLILIRCLLASLDGREVQTLNLLLPRRRIEGLSLPVIGRVAGEPIACDVSAGRGRAAIGLTVGEEAAEVSGIRGTAVIDGSPVEIGQMRLDGRRLRVVVHAVTLERAVG